MIQMIAPLAAGNALRVFLVPPFGGARSWRLMRKLTDNFTGPTDPSALLVYEGDTQCIVDVQGLTNGTAYYYRAYYWDGATYTASASASAVPAASYEDASTDAPSIVHGRLEAGLAVEVERSRLHPQEGVIRVLSAPPVFEDVQWPLVTVHLQNESPSVRGIGEDIGLDAFSADANQWQEGEGWLAKVTLSIVAWSQNPDERAELRRVLRRVLLANLPVFDSEGLTEIEFQLQDVDAVAGEYPAPVYQVMCSFTCLAPAAIKSRSDVVVEVNSTIIEV